MAAPVEELLIQALRVVPVEALPSTLDAFVLATGRSHDALLSTLILKVSQILTEDRRLFCTEAMDNLLKVLLMAVLNLYKSSRDGTVLLEKMVWSICLPLLQQPSLTSAALQGVVGQVLVEAFSTKGAWNYVQNSLVPYFLRSMKHALCEGHEIKCEPCVKCECTEEAHTSCWRDKQGLACTCAPLQFNIMCQLVAVLLSEASREREIEKSKQEDSSAEKFCEDVVSKFYKPMCSIISHSNNDVERQYTIKVLLPPMLNAVDKANQLGQEGRHNHLRGVLQRDLWKSVKSLFYLNAVQKRDAYMALSLAIEFLFPSTKDENNASVDPIKTFSLLQEIEFWDILKAGLVDVDPFSRKRALHVLKAALRAGDKLTSDLQQDPKSSKVVRSNSHASFRTKRDMYAEKEAHLLGLDNSEMLFKERGEGNQKWEAFFLLYGMLEEYGTHLVEAAWNHQITVLLPTLCGKAKPQNLIECPKLLDKSDLLDPHVSIWWSTVLWQQGFQHGNPQVRRLILLSFAELEWEKISSLADFVPRSFVLGTLLSALNDPVNHKDFGVKGIYTSSIATAASRFFKIYSASLNAWDRADFIISTTNELCSRSFCRPGLMTLAMCLEEATSSEISAVKECPSWLEAYEQEKYDLFEGNKSRCSDILDGLGQLIEESKRHFNPKYRLKVCLHTVKAASSIVVLPSVAFSKVIWFVGLFPHDFLNVEGMLCKTIGHWLSADKASSLFDFQKWMTNGLNETLCAFLKPPNGVLDSVVTDEDVEAWTEDSDKWARVASLGLLSHENHSKLMMLVQEQVSSIYKRAYNTTCMPEKILLLLQSLIQVCCLQRKKHGPSSNTGLCEEMSKQLQVILCTYMSELVAHAKKATSFFWNPDIPDCCVLPSSVLGKLGGPSQRRLPASVASEALKGVVAVGTVASAVKWLHEHIGSAVPDSALHFIWEFSWKSINLRNAKTEIEAEIYICLYEALASVFSALATTVSPEVLSTIRHAMVMEDVKDERIIDVFIWNFLENINKLLQVNILARSRRAALLQQKWCCLDSLLAIPRTKIICAPIITHPDLPAVAASILWAVYLDAINSLESAGEDNLFPLLKCVRWLMHWNILQHVDAACNDVTRVEMMWSLVKSAWAAIADCNKRKVAAISAFLSAMLHPNVFWQQSMHKDSGDDGPLKWLVCRLIEQGARSPRTMRLTTMHICGLWLMFPAVAEHYIEELKLLSLHGGESIDEELDGQILESSVTATEYLMLMQSADPELVEEFRNSELYVRVSVAVLVHKFSQLAEGSFGVVGMDQKSASTCGKMLIMKLLNSMVTDADLSKELYKKKSAIHRRKIRAWQMACILSSFVDTAMVAEVIKLLQICLHRNNLPSVRQYAEIFAIQIHLRFPHLVREYLIPALADYNMKTQELSSYVFIAVNILMHVTPNSLRNSFIQDILPAVIPYLTTHHHNLRSFSQILIYKVLWDSLEVAHQSEGEVSTNLEKKCIQSVVSYLDGNADCRRIRVAVEIFLRSFDPAAAATPRGIFLLHAGGEDDPSNALDDIPFECAPIALMDHVSYFLNEAREDLRSSMAAETTILKSEEITGIQKSLSEGSKGAECTSSGHEFLDFQRKLASLRFSESMNTLSEETTQKYQLPNMEMLSLLSEIEREEYLLHSAIHSRAEDLLKMRGNRQDLIVVASLLGRIPNLAGLARTCEVFKASSLVVADASIIQDKQFQLISVTAEMWIPVKEVAESNLHEYLTVKKRTGFTVVGLEQTANSVSLEKYTFPKRTVLVLGNEKEGIPTHLIHSLNACVEIPQLGVIRSLNVHVSGAIAVWEYTRQQLEKR